MAVRIYSTETSPGWPQQERALRAGEPKVTGWTVKVQAVLRLLPWTWSRTYQERPVCSVVHFWLGP